ncbi:NAD(P)-dependent oxidoreductase [Bradyrhizobium sp. AUGA SZCCT0222]|uniref:NAD-dependent epimerase/dehydratase family protein n=1 Tax=Bradyrhizobium sp. AUGA SZCCT0222 TaxID=2807668 RepID=UPI001BA6AF92|nr:NAD(P)-dependent oxidoreductase [Bradyrhizobium sp. AUGA SZCCT0222]MBR1270656.1 NAD(P)-dependent oxidoreductase [Bradyrhizobium sp. AUGA SZCCT0222]
MLGKNLLVTGATGFVGLNLLPRLISAGYTVTALCRKPLSNDSPGVRWVLIGSDRSRIVEEIARSQKIDAVVHLAGRVNGRPKEIDDSNIGYTRDLLDGLQRAGARAEILYLSSVSAIEKLGRYGLAKRAAEKLIEASPYPWKFIRSSLIYGPHERGNVGLLVESVRKWPIVPVIGGSAIELQPLFVEDLCDVILSALAGNGRERMAYVVAGPQQIKLKDMIGIIQSNLRSYPVLLPIPLKPVQIAARFGAFLMPWANLPFQQLATLHQHAPWDSSDAKADFGFDPRIFAKGVKMYVGSASECSER